jgi:hypothetical protein
MTYPKRRNSAWSRWLLAVMCILLSLPATAQQDQVTKAAAAQAQQLLADEQVQLVHSQPWYLSGERLWYSISISRRSSAPPSRVVYATLLDRRGTILLQQKLVVDEGKAQGDFRLPPDLPTGSYTLQAGTNWMRNFSAGQQWRQELLVVNTAEVSKIPASAGKARPLQVQVYAESGAWLSGVPTRMAVQVRNAAGTGIAAHGTVVDTAGHVLTSFQADAAGIATFTVQATHEEELLVQVQAPDHLQAQVPLTRPKSQGMALTIGQIGADGAQVRVLSREAAGYVLLAESRGQVYFAQRGTGAGAVKVPFPENKSEVRLLLLNPGGLVEAERSLYLPDTTGIAVQPDRTAYTTRQQVQVALAGLPPNAALSLRVAARRPAWQPVQAAALIQQYRTDLDLWQAIAAGEMTPRHARETLVEPLRRDNSSLAAQSGYERNTDTAFVQALPTAIRAYAMQHHLRSGINEVYGLTEPHAPAPLPRLPVDRVFKLDDYVAFNDMEEAIREVTTNVRVRRKKGKPMVRLLYVAPGTKRMMKDEPLYLLDGVMLRNMDEIMALDLQDVASIEIAWSEEKLYAGNLGGMVDNGMFAVYTKSGEARERLREKGHAVLYEQYSLPRHFVVPAPTDAVQASQPDFRQLLYWKPILQAGPDGKASATFYTSDETGTFEVQVQGYTSDGSLLQGKATFEVRPVN